MNYYKWNTLIGDSLFNKQKDDIVFLYMTKEQLIDMYKKKFFTNDLDDEAIWGDFVVAVNSLSKDKNIDITFPNTERSFGGRIRRLRDFTKRNEYPYKYPAYLAHLVLLIMGKANSKGNTEAEVKRVIKGFFDQESISCMDDEFSAGNNYVIKKICCSNPNAQNPIFDGGLWKELNQWSVKNEEGTTYFNFKRERYVGMITDQCLISGNVKERIRELYEKSGLNCNERYSLEDFRLHLLSQQRRLKDYFSNQNATSLIKEDIKLVKVLYRDFLEWDGSNEELTRDGRGNLFSNYFLRMCCQVDRGNGTFEIQYRIFGTIPEKLVAKYENGAQIEISEDAAGWSTPIYSSHISEIGGRYHRTRFVFNENADDIYFVTRKQEFGNRVVLVSADSILEDGNTVFFITSRNLGENEHFFTKLPLENSKGYSLYKYNVNFGDGIFDSDGLFYRYKDGGDVESVKNLSLIGGLRLPNRGRNVFLSTFPPQVMDYSFCESIVLVDENNHEHSLFIVTTDGFQDYQLWDFPGTIPSGKYLVKDNRNVEITIVRPSDLLPGETRHLCFDMDGKKRDISYFNNERPYFQDNCFHSFDINYLTKALLEDQYPTTYMCHDNNARLSRMQSTFNNNYGDILIDWLYYRGECPKKEFIETFKCIQNLFFKESERQSYSHTYTAYSALKWLQKAGFVDCYDGKVYPCSPRMIALPVDTNCCNKFHLVGCRSIELIEKVIQACKSHQEMFEFTAYQTQNDYLMSRLTPSSFFIECKGASTNNYGFELVEEHLCEPHNIQLSKPSHLHSLRTFSIGVEDLNEWWQQIDNADYSIRHKFCIFSLDTFEVDKSQKYTFYELQEVLQGVSLVQLYYSEYEYDNIIFDFENNRFIRVPREYESLGKLFVIRLSAPDKFQNECVRWCEDSSTGEVGLAVSKRIGLPRNLSLLMNYASLFPPEFRKLPIKNSRNFYYYIIKKGIQNTDIRAILSNKLGVDLKENTINV